MRWLFDAVWSQGQTDQLAQRVGEVTFHHSGAARRTDGRSLGVVVEQYRQAFPDLRFEVEDLVEQADRVAARLRLRGTHRGAWRELEATGRSIDIDVMMFFRFEDDRLVEIWEVDDRLRREEQLGN